MLDRDFEPHHGPNLRTPGPGRIDHIVCLDLPTVGDNRSDPVTLDFDVCGLGVLVYLDPKLSCPVPKGRCEVERVDLPSPLVDVSIGPKDRVGLKLLELLELCHVKPTPAVAKLVELLDHPCDRLQMLGPDPTDPGRPVLHIPTQLLVEIRKAIQTPGE